MTLTHDQQHILTIVERVASVLSILGIATIIGTFCLSRHFRNPVNRIIFINAFFNIFDALGTMISLSGPEGGNLSNLCQFQGFLMQMFPLTDVLWTLVMAIDVFLIVYYQYDAHDLRKLEIKYIATISIFTVAPAIAFLCVHTYEKGPMYGSVQLWCSVAPKWVLYRIVLFYGPVWFFIFAVLLLYTLVGLKILKQRRLFKNVGNEYITLETAVSGQKPSSSNSIDAEVITAISQPQPVHMEKFYDESEEVSPSSSAPPSHLRKSRNDVVAHGAPVSPVSFRQYILMPLMFFVVLLVVWVPLTANRVSSFINPHFESWPLLLTVGATGSLRGFWNGIVFLVVGIKARKRQKRLEYTHGSPY